MKPSIQTLGQILYSPSQYVIPVFQRNYRWERPQWDQLWESLIEIQSPEKRGNHFMGFLVFVPGLAQPGQHTRFHLVDGQQRLMTTSIVLAATRNVARRLGQEELAKEIHEYYLVHPLKQRDQRYRLLPKERDYDSYVALVSGQGERNGRIANALAYFEDQLVSVTNNAPDQLRRVFDTLCQRLEFMCATLEAENAYNIFKSLNSTGVPLGPSDLIRNFVFMHVPPDEQEAFDRDSWRALEKRFARTDGTLDEERLSRFFRDFLMASGRYIGPKDTLATFEAKYEATEFSPTTLVKTLIENVAYYAVITGDKGDESAEVTRALSGLNILESSTTYPLLLTLFGRRAAGTIDSGQLAGCIEMLRGFILRRFVCGESSRGYGQMFVRALSDDGGDSLKALERFLLERGWPDDQRFKSAFVEFPLYLRGYTREVLETLERARGHKEQPDLSAAQVEHVMPRTLTSAWKDVLGADAEQIHATWLDRPGNLTLSAYNQELGNQPFEKKRERYAQSNIVGTRELHAYERWGEAEIRKRGEQLAQDAARIWIGPKEPPTGPIIKTGPERRELRLRFWHGLRKYFEEECPELPRPEPRPNWTVRVASGVRNVAVELRLGLRQSSIGIDVWFHGARWVPVWERLRDSPNEYDALAGAVWTFERSERSQQEESGRRTQVRMSISQAADVRDERSWPGSYRWLSEKLSLVYERLVPRLRAELESDRSA